MSEGVALLLISDGRHDYLEQTLASAERCLPAVDALIHVDDTEHELGFAGAIQAGWDTVPETGCGWVFHLEADFIFNAPVPLEQMIATVRRDPNLAQMALKRQPWNDREVAAGGLCEADPDEYTEHWRTLDGTLETWTTNRRSFTTNPCVYRASICERGWPQIKHSEGNFTHELMKDPAIRFGLWGLKFGPPWVTHIGDQRTGNGY